MFCEHPWKALRHDKIDLQNEVMKGNRPKIRVDDDESTEIPKDLISLIKESWSAKPEDRPSISSIKDRLYKILEPEVVVKTRTPSHALMNDFVDSSITKRNSKVLVDEAKMVSIEMTAVSASGISEEKEEHSP